MRHQLEEVTSLRKDFFPLNVFFFLVWRRQYKIMLKMQEQGMVYGARD